MYRNTIIIPALNPSEHLITYITELINKGFKDILLVDDGSDKSKQYIFNLLDRFNEVTVIRHAVNLGKGRALKDAFNYVLVHWGGISKGVITADSDGQHTIDDIIKIQNILESQAEPALILGTRDFNEKDVPPKSKYGNKITSFIFHILYGIRIDDTQTGLRAIPKEFLQEYCTLDGERFEYETNMLIYGALHEQKILPCSIKTIYFDKNSETHFRPFIDSLNIYRVILKGFFSYIMSSISATGIDLVLFKIFLTILKKMNFPLKIIFSTIIARVISSGWNFMLNRKMVFRSTGTPFWQACKYYMLCIFQMILSAVAVAFVNFLFSGNELIEKIIVDSVLFFFSYHIQRVWVFKGGTV